MKRKTRWILGLAVGALLIAAYFTTAAVMGAALGEPCDKEWGCKGLDAVCLEGEAQLCSAHCESAADCPTGWTCDDVSVLTFDGKSAEPERGSTLVCLPVVEPRSPSRGGQGT